MPASNVNPAEITHFENLASRWWDPDGESRPLHDLNPVRATYVASRVSLDGVRVADVGCGGGLLSEALARAGARVIGIDMGEAVIDVADLHLHESGLQVDYRVQSSTDLAAAEPESFDVACCMELIEHVPDPGALVADLAALLKPGGHVFLSTVNRTPVAFGAAILGAEYLTHLLPRGTHHYRQFIKPSELAQLLRASDLILDEVAGVAYNPLTHSARLIRRPAVNYLLHAHKPA